MPPFPIFMLSGSGDAVASTSTTNLTAGKANLSDTVVEVANIIPQDDYQDEELPQPAGRKTRNNTKIINSDFLCPCILNYLFYLRCCCV